MEVCCFKIVFYDCLWSLNLWHYMAHNYEFIIYKLISSPVWSSLNFVQFSGKVYSPCYLYLLIILFFFVFTIILFSFCEKIFLFIGLPRSVCLKDRRSVRSCCFWEAVGTNLSKPLPCYSQADRSPKTLGHRSLVLVLVLLNVYNFYFLLETDHSDYILN